MQPVVKRHPPMNEGGETYEEFATERPSSNQSKDALDIFMESIQNELDRANKSHTEAATADVAVTPQQALVTDTVETNVIWDDDDSSDDFEAFKKKKLHRELSAEGIGGAGRVADSEDYRNDVDSDDEVYSYGRKGDMDVAYRRKASSKNETFLLPTLPISEYFFKPFDKNHYVEDAFIQNLSLEDVANLKIYLNINATGMSIPKPVGSFVHLTDSLLPALHDALLRRAYGQPTPIQCQSLPAALSGRDILGIASTGSGKTLSFLLPLITHTYHMTQAWGEDSNIRTVADGSLVTSRVNIAAPYSLILAPTRELAIQIDKELRDLIRKTTLRSALLAGGMNKTEQFRDLKRGAHIITANTGRLIDLVHMKALNFDKITMLVLDEADKMLAAGNEMQVQNIISAIRPDRQVLLFSATMSDSITTLAREILRSPVRITIGEPGNAAATIYQEVVLISSEDKWGWLKRNLSTFLDTGKTLIFCNSQARAIDLSHILKAYVQLDVTGSTESEPKESVLCLYGDMSQTDRLKVLEKFSKSNGLVLVASDVASRGLDIPSIEVVVNYDAANDIDVHTNRIGRCGRKGERGVAYTLVTPSEEKIAAFLVEHLESSGSTVPIDVMNLALRFAPFKTSRLTGMEMVVKSKKAAKKETASKAFSGLGYKVQSSSRSASSRNVSFQRSSHSESILTGTANGQYDLQAKGEECSRSRLMGKGGKRWDVQKSGSLTPQRQPVSFTVEAKADSISNGKIVNVDDDLSSSDEEAVLKRRSFFNSGEESLINVEKRRLQRQRLSTYGSYSDSKVLDDGIPLEVGVGEVLVEATVRDRDVTREATVVSGDGSGDGSGVGEEGVKPRRKKSRWTVVSG